MISRSLTTALSIAVAAGLFVAGCSSLPTSPASSPGAGSTVLGFDVPETDPGSAPDTTTVRPASSSVFVRASKGGTVQAGDFTVIVPPLALDGDAIVTVLQPDVTRPEVELSITPESRNGFRIPVQLVADAKQVGADKLAGTYISWWNPEKAQWEPMAASWVSLAGESVQAPLMHFSRYRVEADGKAGW